MCVKSSVSFVDFQQTFYSKRDIADPGTIEPFDLREVHWSDLEEGRVKAKGQDTTRGHLEQRFYTAYYVTKRYYVQARIWTKLCLH